ncbi:T9SS C-terminal target domain-containing protein [candidate division KSB1 bacterium]|nr:cellulase family glycosylhydrolase [candidate division KSB1 bacterium]RQW00870.1 MAG: T9SS C-terminal target domain-containing protein [candidate division KSB1 bacterium]
MRFAKFFPYALVLFFFLSLSTGSTADLAKGVNIGDWLGTDEAVWIQTTRYQKTDFENMKSLGLDHVRIDVNFNVFEVSEPDYALSEIQYRCLDKAIMWAEELGMKVIITNNEGEISTGTADAIRDRLVMTWKHVASRYAGKGDVVAYEVFATPGETITADAWNGVAAALVAAIREVDATHAVIVGPINDYSLDALSSMAKIDADNVIYAFNFFDPLTFTRQGNSYNDVDYNTAIVPFPYDAGKMPPLDEADAGTAAEEAYNNYPTQGTVDYVKSRLDVAAQFAADNGVAVWCASFGAYIGQRGLRLNDDGWDVPNADRGAWLGTCMSYMQEKNIAACHSGYRGGFGLFYDDNNNPYGWMQFGNFPYDINTDICEAMGLTPPEPGLYSPEPLTEGFVIYDEEVTPLARWGEWFWDDAEVSLFNMDEPAVSQYCLSIFYPGQWQAGDFFFPLYLDMSILAEDGYLLDFFIRCDWEEAHIQARFEDTNEDLDDKPWRMNYNVDNSVVPFDGTWQRVTIPLTSMDDQGAWDPDDEIWYGGPQGLFDWERVQRFQFVSETAEQPDAEIFIDRVRIVSADAVDSDPMASPAAFALAANYPNPFNPTTTIQFTLAKRATVDLSIYNVRGELVKTLVSETKSTGDYSVQWDGSNLNNEQVGSGVYLYRLKADDFEQTRRMLLIR